MQIRQAFSLIRKAGAAWVDDFAPSMGAAISYYTVFSLAPLLVIVIAIAGAVFGREAVTGQIVAQLDGLIGSEGAQFVQTLIKAASDTDKGLVAGLILGVAFLLMASLTVSAGLAALGTWMGGLLPGWEALLHGINIANSLTIETVLFAMIFKLMPSTDIAWRDVWIAAAGLLVVLLAWVYYAAQIFLLGAEFTKVYADEHGSLAGAKAVQGTDKTAAQGKPAEVPKTGPAVPRGPVQPALAARERERP